MSDSLSKEKTELFETMSVSKAVLKLSVPTVVGCLVMVLYNLADTYFVGMLNDPVQTSAVTLAAPVILLFNAVNNLFGFGTASLISRSLGKKDYLTAKKTAAFGFYAAIVCGLLFSAVAAELQNPLVNLLGADAADRTATLDYMRWTVFFGAAPSMLNVIIGNMVRAEGSAVHATVGTAGGCILNMILDPFFIMPWGLGMGAAGAGLATFISNCAACLYFIGYMTVKRNKTFISFNIKYAVPSKYILKDVFGVGVPSAIQNILNVAGMTVLNNVMSVYGTAAVSAMGISYKLTMIPMYIAMGIAQGIMPLVGYNYSSGNKKRIREVLSFTVIIAGVILVILVALFVIFPDDIMKMFMDNSEVVSLGAGFIIAQSLATVFFAVDFLGVGIFQACGIGKYAFYFAVARKLLLEIPAIYLLNYFFGVSGPAYSKLCAEVVLSVAAVIMIRRIIRD